VRTCGVTFDAYDICLVQVREKEGAYVCVCSYVCVCVCGVSQLMLSGFTWCISE